MFRAVSIKNFRCFRDLTIDSLDRVNLIAGKNNVGKTSLLEAVHLHCNPHRAWLWLKINKLRGIDDPKQAFEEIGSWLFFDKNADSEIRVRSSDTAGVERTTTLHLVDETTCRENFPEVDKALGSTPGTSTGFPRLILELREGKQEKPDWSAFRCDSVSEGLSSSQEVAYSKSEWQCPSVFLGSRTSNAKRDVRHFGALQTAKQMESIRSALKIVEPRLGALTIVPLSDEPVIYGDVGLDQLVPVSLMGEGFGRLLSIVLAIGNAKNGVVVIDEIENGLHYSVLPEIWKAVAVAARENSTQVFATTHSLECVRAAHVAFSESEPYDFRYHRLERTESNEIDLVSYDQESLESSLDLEWEVR